MLAPRIFRDLGNGTSYADVDVDTVEQADEWLHIPLSAAAVQDLNAPQYRYYSMGGRLLSLSGGDGDEYLFGDTRPRSDAARLVLTLAG